MVAEVVEEETELDPAEHLVAVLVVDLSYQDLAVISPTIISENKNLDLKKMHCRTIKFKGCLKFKGFC